MFCLVLRELAIDNRQRPCRPPPASRTSAQTPPAPYPPHGGHRSSWVPGYRDRTSALIEEPQITTRFPVRVLPLLPPGIGGSGSTHGSPTILNRPQPTRTTGPDLRPLEDPQVRT